MVFGFTPFILLLGLTGLGNPALLLLAAPQLGLLPLGLFALGFLLR